MSRLPKNSSSSRTEDLYLSPLISEPSSLSRENRRRRRDYDYTAVAQRQAQLLAKQGWQFDKRLKKRTRLRRPKSSDERLENRVWTLLFKLGYIELNEGREFRVRIQRRGSDETHEHVDVFAKDDETVLVARCMSAQTLERKNLHKDISHFDELKGPIATAIKKHYGPSFKPKILWLLVTENIIWSKADREQAAASRIQCITERELRYYNQIANHLGHAARYQFLAEFLAGQRIPALGNHKTSAIRGKLGGRTFFSFLIPAEHLLKIAFINHRSLNDPKGLPSYQRLVSKSRLRAIHRFLEDGGFFPTNLLVNFPERVRFDPVATVDEADLTYGELYLPDKYKSAWIIDGQHRLYGYSGLTDWYLRQPLIIVAFQGLSSLEEANLFVTINHEQKSVPRNLLDELEGDLQWGSSVPAKKLGALAARVIQLLNDDFGEPFYNRVTAQGIRTTVSTCLTVPQVKNGLKRSGLLGQALRKQKIYQPGPLAGSSDSETLDRARTVLNLYFCQIQEANYDLWDSGREGYICTNVGIQGYLLLFASVLRDFEARTGKDARLISPEELVLEVKPYLEPILDFLSDCKLDQAQKTFSVPYGAGGPRQYHFRLCRFVRKSLPDFAPPGYLDWETEQSEERIKRAEGQLKDIHILVQHEIFHILRRVYGEKDYWETGVTSVDMRVAAYERQQQNPPERRLPLENYLDFLDYKKIIAKGENWAFFKPIFDIPEPSQKGKAKNLDWMERVNELRRIPAHPTQQRQFTVGDFEYLDWIEGELNQRLRARTSDTQETGPSL